MFDPETSNLLRSAPLLPGLDPSRIPSILTRHYAELVSFRIRGSDNLEEDAPTDWTLDKIADAYELIVSVSQSREIRRPSAFVAATAQQIIARRRQYLSEAAPNIANVDGDLVDPAVSAALLFLAAEQYADANEAAAAIIVANEQLFEATILAEHIIDLARGRLHSILERAERRPQFRAIRTEITHQALRTLLETLVMGVELMAAELLATPLLYAEKRTGPESSRQIFDRVLYLSAQFGNFSKTILEGRLPSMFAGPRHMASLLLAVHDGISEAALTKIRPPAGADNDFWNLWIDYRAKQFPFVWPNHREAIAKGFHEPGKSAVLVLPTGAGKTTVSSLKIAGVLAQRKRVIFLAPTHALVEQLTNDLQEIFPEELLGAEVSKDFDLLLSERTDLPAIEVMTPEKCLAMLSFSPELFESVGLLVFDECHLLSPEQKKMRRALDGMLCVLAFNKICPSSDLLFLSAMLKNGADFARWIESLTGRICVDVELLWKPSRQARGVVIYDDDEVEAARTEALKIQTQIDSAKSKKAKSLRGEAARALTVTPFALWGLQHNWLTEVQGTAFCSYAKLSDTNVTLAGELGYSGVRIKPNANDVAAALAIASAKNGLKTIVFVNQKAHAVSKARIIADGLGLKIEPTKREQECWDALAAELGSLKHSLLDGPVGAVPHNASMLRLERELAESMYRRSDGAQVIVATPTLAQGLNLPAHLAILAGDKRTEKGSKEREDLQPHEILNAAARAGRAGHLANGVVLLVPEPVLTFPANHELSLAVQKKLQSVLPEDDRCVIISDPVEKVLDLIMSGETLDKDVQYMINRMTGLRAIGGYDDPAALFNLKRGYGFYAALHKNTVAEFELKLEKFKELVIRETPDEVHLGDSILASQSGLSTQVIANLRALIISNIGQLPQDVMTWSDWVISWLQSDTEARNALLSDVESSILSCTGSEEKSLTAEVLGSLIPALRAWLGGRPIAEIEVILGGQPNSHLDTLRTCPRARDLITTVIGRALSFVMGLVTSVVKDVDPYELQPALDSNMIEALSQCLRLGFDSVQKLQFLQRNKKMLGRVSVHQAYDLYVEQLMSDLDDLFDL